MRYSLWHNAPTMLPATSTVHYTTSCNTQSSVPEDGRDHRPKHVEMIGITNKPSLSYLVGVYIIDISDAQSNKYQICIGIVYSGILTSSCSEPRKGKKQMS